MSRINNVARMKRFSFHPGYTLDCGFTLLEILIALFIFAMLALLLSSALHNVIGIQSRTEQNADRLHETQIALLIMSRDITQAVNRSVVTASGKEEAAFVGKPNGFTFTHAGVANPEGKFLRSGLQRTRYFIDGKTLWRNTWAVLDQAPQSAPLRRALLSNLDGASFEYLDSKNVFHHEWPVQEGAPEPLPRAVRIYLDISKWGRLSQLYVIPAEPPNAANAQPAKQKQEPQPEQAPQPVRH
jgi:general secretion pathway protein J